MKKIVACVLALTLLVGAILFALPTPIPIPDIIAPARVVAAPVPRDGYYLVPTLQGPSGVDTDSAFVLTSPYDQADTPKIVIDGQPEPTITRTGDNEFLLTPALPMQANSLYLFRLIREGLTDITWAFQTTVRFAVTSTLPANMSTNVPVDTGIEISFSSPDHTDVESHFSIYPSVEGRFISRGGTTIFMPLSPLSHQQLYTVTLTAGVSLPGTNEIIAEDHVFAFETEASGSGRGNDRWEDIIRFFNRYVELPSFEPPQLNFTRNSGARNTQPTVNVAVYSFGDRDAAIQAFNQLIDTPRWAHFAWQNSLIDTRGLSQIMSFDVTEIQSHDRWFETMVFPDALPPGFYLVNATVEGFRDQVIIQITDLAVHIVADNDSALIWVNDMTTGQPAVGAQVFDKTYDGIQTTDANGIVVTNRALEQGESPAITITATDGKEITLFFTGGNFFGSSWWWGGPAVDEDYWTVLQLDRTLFQRSDTLYFWGFVQSRSGSTDMRHLTATITQGWGWHLDTRDILHRQTISVSGGAYSGTINLPHLDPGTYNLTIRHGDTIVGSTFFNIEDYVKPPYQMLISSDRRAVFAGEEVTFTARAEFFEGTPVAELPISYHFWGWALRDIPGGRDVTGLDGEFARTVTPIASGADIQGRVHLEFSAEATLPEVGLTWRHSTVEVFINDIEVQAQATRKGEDASLSVNVNNITLDRINDGTAQHWGDFLCDPVAGQVLNVEVYRVWWVPVRTGERYCFIERRVVPRYRHERMEEVIERFTMTTDANGEAARDFTVPNRENESYHARIRTTDGNGRAISHSLFIGRDWSFLWWGGDDELFLVNDREWDETYDVGDEVELTVMQNGEVVNRGAFLFVVMQNGILHYQVGTQNPFTFDFAEMHVPNVTVYAYHFNGHIYRGGWQMNQRLRFNSQARALQINVTADRETYRPGDMSTLTVTVTDMDGNPKAANVNVSVVDEALFALQDHRVDTLSALYQSIGDGRLFSMSTHRTFRSEGTDETWGMDSMFRSSAMYSMEEADMMALDAPASANDSAMYAGVGGDTHLREIFMDTAIFASQRTNTSGLAEISFQLPDNITSWRVTISAISNDLYAGNVIENIIVTNPMFLHYALGGVFLVGDVPTIGVNAYGTSLTGGETINFEVWDEENPALIRRASGTAFERVNIPLWEMEEEGAHGLIIYAYVVGSTDLRDAVRHGYRVVSTHRQMDTTVFYDVTANTQFAPGVAGLTNITFTDHGRGQFLWDLMGMRHVRGIRLEGLVARREADRLIAEHFPDANLWHWCNTPFDPLDYQRQDGGLSWLPYSESCLETTVMLMPFLLDDINVHALRNYLYNTFEGAGAENKMLALYGLALLREPVLLDLQAYAMLTDLSVRDVAFIALGFAALGETVIATEMYQERILPYLQSVELWYRAYENLGNSTILETTSTVALLAAKLNMPESLGLHQYAARLRTCDMTILIERLTFISREINNFTAASASITYTLFGEEFTRDLSHWGYTLRIPAQNMNQFRITSVTGDVGAVSIHRTPLEEIQVIDNDIIITRRFLREEGREVTGSFQQDELIRVEISIDYSAKAIDGSYMVTDFLPAGLAFVQGSARFMHPRHGSWWAHARQDGQRVIFFDFNGRFDGVRTYYYYARVINPGVFIAEGTVVQNMDARAYLTIGDDAVIVVE